MQAGDFDAVEEGSEGDGLNGESEEDDDENDANENESEGIPADSESDASEAGAKQDSLREIDFNFGLFRFSLCLASFACLILIIQRAGQSLKARAPPMMR